MVNVIGIDPGSKSVDICMLCDGKICYEKSFETSVLAENPQLLVDELTKQCCIDLIALPSGYGVEVTKLTEIPKDIFEEWYYTFILASTKEDILLAVRKGVFGAKVYYAIAEFSKLMRNLDAPGIFIPGIINLPTIPLHRKINKVDMGTADKLAVVTLGIHEVAEKNNLDYEKVSYIHVEVGYGYAAVVAVKNGKVVDAYGGTTMPGPAFLTAGALDLEVVQAIALFNKEAVFASGCSDMLEIYNINEWLESTDEKSITCFNAFVESVIKATYSLLYTVKSPLVILLSGRLARSKHFVDTISDALKNVAPVERMHGLPGAQQVKETAQGYAVIVDGISGGVFKELVEHVEIHRASGSALDYILLKQFFESSLGKNFVKLRSTLKSKAFNMWWWNFDSSRQGQHTL